MTLAAEMLRLSPSSANFSQEELAACIEACFDCVQVCTACADACVGEDDVAGLRRCIALNLSCADACAATGRVLTRQYGSDTVLSRAMLEASRQACRACAEECERPQGVPERVPSDPQGREFGGLEAAKGPPPEIRPHSNAPSLASY